jgi:glycosyltransferase involved in cell wall biosynthesis
VRRQVIIHWGISSFFGFGVYGLNLALNWWLDPQIEPLCSAPIRRDQIRLDPLRQRALEPFLANSQRFQDSLKAAAGTRVQAAMPLLAGVDDTFRMVAAAHDVQLTGRPTLATVFFETGAFAPDVLARAQAYDEIITGSTWNEEVLREHGITRLRTVLQGVDPTLFHPAPRAGILGDRFLVFSGGKLERRKGQDIALAAFRAFAQSHPDAVLVTAWHSPWPKHASSLDASGLVAPVPFTADGRVDVMGWAQASGLAAHQVLDLGAVANASMPALLREMDVALFPNRCEGGTNLVAMETMACGVPTILSANTGHRDLIEGDNCYALTRQAPVPERPGWGESDLDEIVAALEAAYADRDDARRRGAAGAATLAALPWSRTAREIKAAVLDHAP